MIWKVSKGLDKKLLQSNLFNSFLKLKNAHIEITIPQPQNIRLRNSLHMHDIAIIQPYPRNIVIPRLQVVKLSEPELPPYLLFLN